MRSLAQGLQGLTDRLKLGVQIGDGFRLGGVGRFQFADPGLPVFLFVSNHPEIRGI
jgi:hypothetical protein